jgi:hypothetical protein
VIGTQVFLQCCGSGFGSSILRESGSRVDDQKLKKKKIQQKKLIVF